LLGKEDSACQQVVKLCDFGTCDFLSQDKPRTQCRAGTFSYTAPELYMGRGGTECADMWSMGVVLYVMLTGANPFKTALAGSTEESLQKICEAAFEQRRSSWVRCSETGQDLVKRLLVVGEEKRYTCIQASMHRWLASSDRPLTASGFADPPGIAKQAPALLARVQQLATLPPSHRAALVIYVLAAWHEDLEACRLLFLALDRDKDGQVSFAEFATGIKDLIRKAKQQDSSVVSMVNEQQLNACLIALDASGSKMIEWTEFAAASLLESDFTKRGERIGLATRLAARCPVALGTDANLGDPHPHISQHLAPVIEAIEAARGGQAEAVSPKRLHATDTMVKVPAAVADSMKEHHAAEQLEERSPVADRGLGLVVSPLNAEFLLVGVADPERLSLKVMSKLGVPFIGCASVKAWNEECRTGGKPRQALECDDCIVQVDGVRGDSNKMMALLLQAVRDSDLTVDLRIINLRKVEATLQKPPGKSLGMQVRKKGAMAFGLELEEVDSEGIVAEWNAANPRQVIKPGDIIVEVSGFRGLRQDLLQEVVRKDVTVTYLTFLQLSIFCL